MPCIQRAARAVSIPIRDVWRVVQCVGSSSWTTLLVTWSPTKPPIWRPGRTTSHHLRLSRVGFAGRLAHAPWRQDPPVLKRDERKGRPLIVATPRELRAVPGSPKKRKDNRGADASNDTQIENLSTVTRHCCAQSEGVAGLGYCEVQYQDTTSVLVGRIPRYASDISR